MSQTARLLGTVISPGTIVTGSFTDTAGGSYGGGLVTVHYYNVGKLYFGFYTTAGGRISFVGVNGATGVPLSDTYTEIAAKLGITIAAQYSTGAVNEGTNRATWYDNGSGFWDFGDNGNNVQALYAILAV